VSEFYGCIKTWSYLGELLEKFFIFFLNFNLKTFLGCLGDALRNKGLHIPLVALIFFKQSENSIFFILGKVY
jgi:hypothetical protein